MYFAKNYATGKDSVYQGLNNHQPISIGEVVSVIDPQQMGRIKVRIYGAATRGGDNDTPGLIREDGSLDVDVLPWCMPMLPKFISVQPKKGETVYIMTLDKNKGFIDRLYFGPVISQPQNLNDEQYRFSPLGGIAFANKAPNMAPETIPSIDGVFPNPQDISIQGRYNTDITQKHNEILLRAGKFTTTKPSLENPYDFSFNTKTQGYIQIKNDVTFVKDNSVTTKDETERGSVTNIVSSKINLLTHKNGSPLFTLNNNQNLISDDELSKILETAHQLPFGDVLLEYLRLMKDAIFNHVHNGNGNSATDLTASGNKQSIAAFKAKADDLEKTMLSKNIRIN